MSVLPLIGTILSHGYMVGGFLPIRVALPCLNGILPGPSVAISPQIMCEELLYFHNRTKCSV